MPPVIEDPMIEERPGHRLYAIAMRRTDGTVVTLLVGIEEDGACHNEAVSTASEQMDEAGMLPAQLVQVMQVTADQARKLVTIATATSGVKS